MANQIKFEDMINNKFKVILSELYSEIDCSTEEIKNIGSVISLIGALEICKNEDFSQIDLEFLEINLYDTIQDLQSYPHIKNHIEQIKLLIKAINLFYLAANDLEEFEDFDAFVKDLKNIANNESYEINSKPVISISNYSFEVTASYIENEAFAVSNILLLIKVLLEHRFVDGNNYVLADKILITGNEEECINSIIAYRKMEIVSEGNQIHNFLSYTQKPKINFSRTQWSGSNSYIQFNDICTIFSEYNYQKSYLDKFFKLYHILENFMIRSIICDSTRDGFNVRHFQNLYNKFEKNEKDQLKSFLSKVMELEYSPTSKFIDVLFSQLIDLKTNCWISNRPEKDHLENFLKSIGREKIIYSTNNNSEFINTFSSLLYSIRCSIVHNKETEFHLTTANQIDFVESKLAAYYLQAMEEIILYLIFNKNALVWYNKKTVNLY